MADQWKCTVCGYVHNDTEAPALCPVCGVGKIKFAADVSVQKSLVQEMFETFQPHAVAAHFPNALVPTALVFTVVALLIAPDNLDAAVWYLLLVLVPTASAALVTGLYEWKVRFKGKSAIIFRRKIQFAALLLILLGVTIGLRYWLGDPLTRIGPWTWFFSGLLLAMLGCVTMLGHYGGKLVFSLMNRS